uniref:Uncharacterized protein n=1 Tax=Tanacetum cinerariifolium TaxID=118510 RepID=A0A699VBC7_TANCI|nr:hypothetical protein [Tanacetum cinerariifolium]
MSVTPIEQLIAQRVTEALAAQDTNIISGKHPNGNRNSAGGGERTIHICTYKDFLNYRPHNFRAGPTMSRMVLDEEKMT